MQSSMISIRKYLNGERTNDAAQPEAGSQFSENLLRFSSAVLDSIHDFVLTGDGGQARRPQLLAVKESLRRDLTAEEASRGASSVARLLADHQASLKRAGAEQVIEAQHLFAMLNQALVVLTEGSERGMSQLGTIQESLQRASTLRDVTSMKALLAETVQFVEKESTKVRETAAQVVGKFETEVSNVRKTLGNTRLELEGRPEGVSEISQSLKSLAPGEAIYLVAYLWERLTAVTQRYGQGVAEEMISRLISERLKPVMPGNTMYRWTPSSLVAVFSRPRDAEKVKKEVADLNRAPLVHKIVLSGRTAVLTISPSHMVAEGVSEPPAVLVEQVDKFTRA
jgi:hypothetical protein